MACSLSNSAGLGVGDPSQDRGASLSRSVGGGGNLSGKLTLSRTYELPQDVTAQNLLNDPIGTLQSASNGVEEVDRSATLTLSAQGGVTGASGSGQGQYTGGREVQLKIGADPSQIVQSGFGEQLFNGDFQGAARSLGDGVTFEAKSESITTTGFQVAPEFTAMGYGVGFEAQATREDRTTLTEEKVTGSQMAEYIQQSLTN